MSPAFGRLPAEVEAALGHYVYVLRDPRDKTVFYVGKGMGSRVLAHQAEAEKGGTKSKVQRIRSIRDSGNQVEHLIVRSGLPTEHDALVVEQAVIDALLATGTPLTNLVKGHDSYLATLQATIARWSAPEAPPLPTGSVVFILRKAWRPDLGPAEIYDATRGHWRIGKRNRDLAKHAFGVANGVIRGAYAIESWYPSIQTGEAGRWGFEGVPMNDAGRYVGTNVRHLLNEGAQNPVRLFI